MKKIKFLLLFFISLLIQTAYAGNNVKVQNFINHKDWSFVENKGQIATPNPAKGENCYDLHPEIKYYGHQGGVYLYCKPGMISFVFSKVENSGNAISEATGMATGFPRLRGLGGFGGESAPSNKITTNRADLVLIGSNPSAEIIASGQQAYYENFYLSHTGENGITNMHTFKTVIYNNIYPNIDMVIHARAQGVKYEFVVYPGGKVSDIQMQWIGLQKMEMTENGGIIYSLGLGMMEETNPLSFLNNGKKIESRFKKILNRIQFDVQNYDKHKILTIDPLIVWSTYIGGSDEEEFLDIVKDASDNLLLTGFSNSTSGIASSGAYQTSMAGDVDAVIVKFSSAGVRLWGTYFGGEKNDYAADVATDASGNVFIAGDTRSTSGMATSGAYQTSFGGGFGSGDGMMAKFSATGSRVWSTYFGGSNDDYISGIYTDGSGNVVIAGGTNSTSGISTSGAYQVSLNNTGNDAFVSKFSNGGSITWSTYFGGNNNDYGVDITVDASNNIFMSGTTTSTSGIASTGAYQTSLADTSNSEDVFLAKFTPAGSLSWSTYFGGPAEEYGAGLITDPSGNIYFEGQTASSTGIASAGSWQTSYGGNRNAFLAKFSSSGSRIWSTYFGGAMGELGANLAIDPNGNLWMTGYTGSSSGIASPGALQSQFGGALDAFLAEFSPAGNRLWSTYFGGTGDDEANSLIIDGSGNIYMAGHTTSLSNIATSGAFSTSMAGNVDGFLVKFSLKTFNNDAGVVLIKSPTDTICSGPQQVKVQLENFGNKDLNSVTIGWSVNRKNQKPYSWSGKLITDSSVIITIGNGNFLPGDDTIKVWTLKPNGVTDSLSQNDSAWEIVFAKPSPDATFTVNTILSLKESFLAEDTIQLLYQWDFGNGKTANTFRSVLVFAKDSTYKIKLIVTAKNGCSAEFDSLLHVKYSSVSNSSRPLNDIKIFPNPFSTSTTIQYHLNKPSQINISIWNLTGKQIAVITNEKQIQGDYNTDIKAEKYHLKPGMYLLKFEANNQSISKQLIKF